MGSFFLFSREQSWSLWCFSAWNSERISRAPVALEPVSNAPVLPTALFPFQWAPLQHGARALGMALLLWSRLLEDNSLEISERKKRKQIAPLWSWTALLFGNEALIKERAVLNRRRVSRVTPSALCCRVPWQCHCPCISHTAAGSGCAWDCAVSLPWWWLSGWVIKDNSISITSLLIVLMARSLNGHLIAFC